VFFSCCAIAISLEQCFLLHKCTGVRCGATQEIRIKEVGKCEPSPIETASASPRISQMKSRMN
jgi:hypothetical protein